MMPLKITFGGHESPDLADGCFPRHALLKEAKEVAIPRRLWRLQPAKIPSNSDGKLKWDLSTQEVHGIPSIWKILPRKVISVGDRVSERQHRKDGETNG